MKRITALILTLVLMFSFSMSAFARVTPALDKDVVRAGENVTVTLTLEDETLTDVNCFEYWIFYDAEKFEFKESKKGNVKAIPADEENDELSINCSNPVKRDGKDAMVISVVDTYSEGLTVNPGVLRKVTFTAKEDLTAGEELGFVLQRGFLLTLKDGKQEDIAGAGQLDKTSLTVTVGEPYNGYTATVPEGITAVRGEEIAVPFTVSNTDETVTAYNAFQLKLNYDTAMLSFVRVDLGETAVATESTASPVRVSDQDGILTITGCGGDRSAPITVVFTDNGEGNSIVTLTEARIDKAANAPSQDTPDAAILNAQCEITVSGYEVSLDNDFTGDGFAVPGEDYTFTARDKNYDYNVTVTVDGTPVEGVVNNGDGTYTIPAEKITGAVTVETVQKTPKTFDVTLSDELVDGADKADYQTDYTFTLKDVDGYTVSLEGITIDGTAYTNYRLADGTYTIPGADITGAIVISTKKEEILMTETTVTFEGNSGDVVGGTTQKAERDKDFLFEINKDEAYDYTVMLGDEELRPNAEGKYVIPADKLSKEGVKVTIEKTPRSALTVHVSEYLKLGSNTESKTMWLVTAAGTLGEGKVFAYDKIPMFWSEKYDAYAWLVITEGSETLTEEAARAEIKEAAADKTEVAYNFDVNMTNGVVDTNDAQLIYNMYNFYYNDFTTVSMEKFLRADLNGDKTINVSDAAAVVDHIMGK